MVGLDFMPFKDYKTTVGIISKHPVIIRIMIVKLYILIF
jgi:hypothetical protein